MKTCIGNWKPLPKIETRVDASFGPVLGETEKIVGVRAAAVYAKPLTRARSAEPGCRGRSR